MKHKELLLESLNEVQVNFPSYYEKLKKSFNINTHDDIDEYLNSILFSSNRSFFTISSKESFNNLESEKNWNKAIIFEPLNDHSRVFMHKGDIVFCYRQGQFDDLNEALNMRGIYGVGIVASEPEKLYSDKEKEYQNYGVCIVFPFSLKEHLELRNIQLNPITISLTPYNGNRNDALQHIQDKRQYTELLKMICNKNPQIKEHFEKLLKIDISFELLPTQYWNKYNTKTITNTANNDSPSAQTPQQTIYYGVPGSGKSHKIEEITKSLPEEQTIRVVFHPEYTNADFVGQILPHVENTVDYRFKAGPFSRILKKAYENPTKPYFLVIEEINRGNAATIFGDFFQLLDRDSDGWSSYSVENLDINAFIRSNDSTYTDKYSDIPTTKEIGNTTWTENTGIRLPPNLSILASMNTSDQNVFTLDNAFQRRWDMKLVENTFEHEGASLEDVQNANIQKKAKITVANQTITWGNFQSKINEIIGNAANESGFSSMEDKRLGCWFIKNEKGIIDIEKFANKVLKYLWDDAFKFNRTEFFGDIKNFEDLKKDFASKGFSIFNIEDFVFESNDNSFAETQSEETTEN